MERLNFNMKFTNVEKFNSLFSKCIVYVASPLLNRNNSFISKEAFNDAIGSLYGIPIIGEYLEDTNNFGGHGGKIEISDKGINWIPTTKAYGFVPESAEVYWEEVEEDGKMVDYLVVKDALLWSSRYPEVFNLVDKQFGQSMEIEIVDDDWKEIDGQKVFEIKKFIFSALCILGISTDDDPDGHVEPCFKSASISAYSHDKKFKDEFKQMINELKFSLEQAKNLESAQKGGQKMEELQKLLKKYSLTVEDLSAKEINHEDFSLEELESKIQEVFPKEEPKQEFTLTSEQLEDELSRELSAIEMIQDTYWEDYSYPRFSFIDYMPEQMVVVAFDCKEEILIGFNYQLINENVEVDADSAVRYKVNFVPMDLAGDPDNDSEFDVFSKHFTSHSQVERKLKVKEDELNKQFQIEKESAQETLDKAYADFAKLQEEFSKLEVNAKELEEFKLNHIQQERENAENELFERFTSAGLSEDDLSTIKETKANFTIEELEEKLFAIAGRKKLSFSKSPEQKPIRYNLPTDTPKSDKEWADLIEQYKNK